MMRRLGAGVVGLAACSAPPVDLPSVPQSTARPTSVPLDVDTGHLATDVELSGWCEATAHPLRFECALVGEDAARWTVYDEGGTELRAFDAAGSVATLWGLPPDRDLLWTAQTPQGSASGKLRTGSLPAGVRDLRLATSGDPSELESFVVPFACNGASGLVMVETSGDVLWYDLVTASKGPNSGLTGFHFSADNIATMVLDRSRVRSVHATGEVAFEVDGFSTPLHHDVTQVGESLAVLYADELDGRVLDGLYFLDPQSGAVVANWWLADHLTPVGTGTGRSFWEDDFPGAADWSHANGVEADGTDHLLLSLRWQHAVLRIVGDPLRHDFGTVDWAIVGDASSDLTSDLAWIDGGGFVGQHHGARLRDGGLSVFDNRRAGEPSRALLLDLNLDERTVKERIAYDMGRRCPLQGGVVELPGGGVVATCNPVNQVVEFASGQAKPVWTGTLSCDGATPWNLQRAIPVWLD